MKKEVKIGVFAFVMLLLLFWGINFLKGKNLFTSTHTFYTTFDNVEGINVSGDVMFRGIKVGTVTDITFDPESPDRVLVEFTVGKQYPLPNDSRITTNSPVIGNKMLVVEYGHSSEMFHRNDTIPSYAKPELLGQLTGGLEPVKVQLAEMVENLNRTLGSVNSLLSEETLDNISRTMANIRTLSGQLQVSANNLNAITGTLKNNGDNIDRILANASEFSDSLRTLDLNAVVGNLSSTMAELHEVVSKLNGGDGSLAQLLNDPALYEGLLSSSENLSLLLEDLKANPNRYVHFSLFGRKNN